MAMQPKTEINVGIDNEATVNIGNTIIKHQIRRQEAKLREERMEASDLVEASQRFTANPLSRGYGR